MNPPPGAERLATIVGHMEAGREAEAIRVLADWSTSAVRDSALHVRVADLAEELGLGDRLVLELNLAFRDAPDELDLLRRLAHVHADAGRSERAVKCWRALVERAPEEVEAWEELGGLLASLGLGQEARDAYTRGLQATGDRRFEGLLRQAAGAPATREEEAPPGLSDEAVLTRIVSLFSGREGVYARQWVNEKGQTGYTPVREPFNVRAARNHVLGNHTVGIYPVRLDNTVNFAALDLDLSRALVDRSGPGRPEWEQGMARLQELATRLERAASEQGLAPCLADSGSKGRHLWFFFAEPLPAGLARRMGQALVRGAGPLPPEVTVEVFPKQAQLPPNGLGNLIKIPLGVHRLSGRRVDLLGRDGAPVADQPGHLMALPRTSREAVLRCLERAAPELEEVAPPWGEGEAGPSAAPAARVGVGPAPYHPDSDPELQTVLSRCVTLRALAQKVETERALSHDEVNVVVYTLGHLQTGPSAVNWLLRRCPTVDARLHMKSRLRGNPMSCPKIRARVPEVTRALPCQCDFPSDLGLYPNPILHLQVAAPAPGGALDALQFQSLVQDFLRARQNLHEAERVHRLHVERMSSWFDQAGVEEFQTPMGRLRRVREGEGPPRFLLDV